MATSPRKKSSSMHKFNLMLTQSQYQRLKDYAEAEEKDMAEVIRDLIKTLPMKQKPTIE
jgi:protein-arginine kinase activator protein McsA